MAKPKRLVVPTDDNWHDYLPMYYLEKLVKESPAGPAGYDGDDKVVTRLLAWVAYQSGSSSEFRFEMSRYDAAVFLKLVAGRDARAGTPTYSRLPS